jgi:ribosomal protein S18 acetylase RimI-like enzyme
VNIRRASADDVPAIADIVDRAYSPYIELIGRRPGPLDTDYYERLRDADVFVAEEGEAITGLLVLMPAPDYLWLSNIAVDPRRQGLGIGRALLAHADAYAAEHGLPEIRLRTNAAMTANRRLYEHVGYREMRIEDKRVYFAKRVPGSPVDSSTGSLPPLRPPRA